MAVLLFLQLFPCPELWVSDAVSHETPPLAGFLLMHCFNRRLRFPLRSPFTLFAIVLCSSLAGTALAGTALADDAPLPRDPGNVYGKYDNGLKYVIRKSATPPGRVSVWLHVRTGAINETDKQNGLAHFIEHMSFNGS